MVAAGLLCVALGGCTTIERVNVNTVAVDCNVERGDEKQAQGSADASVLQQQGQGAAAFVGSLRSTVVCRDGTTGEASVDGGDLVRDPDG